MSEISNVCKAEEGHYLQAIKIVHHHANGRFDWLISGHQGVKSFERSNFYNVWEIQKIYVCPSCGQNVSTVKCPKLIKISTC